MFLSKPLSYESSKFIAASLDYNIRIQLTKRCPSFLTIHKTTSAKVSRVLVTQEQITIEKTSYQISAYRLQGSPFLLLTVNSGNSQKVEWLDTTVNVENAIDYLIQIFFGKRRDNYRNLVKQTLEPNNLVVNALCFSLAKLTYPFLNTAKKLTICKQPNFDLIEVTNPRICIGMVDKSELWTILYLTQMSESVIVHPVHYSVELAGIFEFNEVRNMLNRIYGVPTKKIFSDGNLHKCNNWNNKSESLEVNAFLDDFIENGRRVYRVHVIVCRQGTGIPIEDN